MYYCEIEDVIEKVFFKNWSKKLKIKYDNNML